MNTTLHIFTNRPENYYFKGKGGGIAGGKSKKRVSGKSKRKKTGGKSASRSKTGSMSKNQQDTRSLFTNESKTVNKEGKEYLVVLGVPVREQVMNTYLLPAEEIRPEDWNGTPISIRHAQANNGSVQVEQPDVPIIGQVMNASWDEPNKRMLAEYWFDMAETMKHLDGQTIISAIKNGNMLETSTAYWADEEYTPGVHNGRSYKTVHRNPKRDHIAVFPDAQIGACSIKDGCGVNRNMKQNCNCTHKNNSDYPDYQSNHLPTEMLIGYALNKGSRTQIELDSARAYVEKNGITKPVWVQCYNGKYRILDGNHRVYLAEELGIDQIPVRVVNENLMELDPEAVYRRWLHEQDQGYLFQQGGQGSGNFDHSGRQGMVGGSTKRGSRGDRSAKTRKETSKVISEAKSTSFDSFGKPRSYDDFVEGGPGLHKGQISSALETKVLSVDGDRVRVKTDYNFGSFGVRTVIGNQPKVGDTVKLIQEQKKGPKGNISTWNYVVTQ